MTSIRDTNAGDTISVRQIDVLLTRPLLDNDDTEAYYIEISFKTQHSIALAISGTHVAD